MTDTRLIEHWLPINEIGTEAIRERAGAIPNPEPHQLHVWWARRPLVPSRASVASSLLPSDWDHEAMLEVLGTYRNVHLDQRRMVDARTKGTQEKIGYQNRRAFTYNPSQEQQAEIAKAAQSITDTTNPKVLDLTAGGGSIPFEAGRLGFATIANELNPVAAFILRATCEWPQQYGHALIDAYKPRCPTGSCPKSPKGWRLSIPRNSPLTVPAAIVPIPNVSTRTTGRCAPRDTPKRISGRAPSNVQNALGRFL